MKSVGKKALSGMMEILMWILMAMTVAMLAVLPWFVDTLIIANLNPNAQLFRTQYFVTLSVSGVMALLMLWQARGILHNVNTGTIFSMKTVRRMNMLGAQFLALAIFYVVMLFCGMTKFAIGLLGLVFFIAGMMMFVFAELFKEATLYKQENDMTI